MRPRLPFLPRSSATTSALLAGAAAVLAAKAVSGALAYRARGTRGSQAEGKDAAPFTGTDGGRDGAAGVSETRDDQIILKLNTPNEKTSDGIALDGRARPLAGASGGALRAWAELLRLPALFTVPGDVLAGTAASGARPGRRTLLVIGSSACLYEAGMALNDWADRAEDAVERPHRPLPSGRVRPSAALAASGALTATGLALAAAAGRPALTVATGLAATVWAYDLGLKHTLAGPVAMGAARALDLLLGAAAADGRIRPALSCAAILGTHTLAVTTVSRYEAQGGSTSAPLAALAVTTSLATAVALAGASPGGLRNSGHRGTAPRTSELPAGRRAAAAHGLPGPGHRVPAASAIPASVAAGRDWAAATGDALRAVLAAEYVTTAAGPLLHAALNPSPQLTQRAVGAGIRATIPLQAALTARAGGGVTALLLAALAPAARTFARKVSVT